MVVVAQSLIASSAPANTIKSYNPKAPDFLVSDGVNLLGQALNNLSTVSCKFSLLRPSARVIAFLLVRLDVCIAASIKPVYLRWRL